MSKNVLVLGNGGREHAIVWKLLQSEQVKRVYVNDGSIGMKAERVEFVHFPGSGSAFNSACSDWCLENSIDLVVVGPEAPLANGVADVLNAAGVPCFGPTQAAARIESDKDWAKSFFDRHGIPTARWASFKAETGGDGKAAATKAKEFIHSAAYPALVVKASGLAAGKGVVVAATRHEAAQAVDEMLVEGRFGAAGSTVVVEELLEGEEMSVLAFCDGSSVRMMAPAQDHKRHLDGDRGDNTGGMGAFCPCTLLSQPELQWVEEEILQKTVDGLREEGCPFTGVLYAGLMLTADGPKVLEFNCRFGDPETQVILPLLDTDLFQIMMACCGRNLRQQPVQWKNDRYAVGVVMASRGYPQTSSKGDVIMGLPSTGAPDLLVFHSGISSNESGELVTNGGRVLIAVAAAADLAQAAATATAACAEISFVGAQFRRDIAHKGIARSLLDRGQLTYKASGVDIEAGDSLVAQVKRLVGKTNRSGVMGSIGGFGGLFDVKAAGYVDPLLVSGTDGVGTKLKIAQQCGDHSTIGIDLVAMCVNDILANAAEPLFFLDYFACGKLDVGVASQVVGGVATGCQMAGCALIGGETAEMPGLYAEGDYDLAGFAVGAVERTKLLPLTNQIVPGDVVIGLASSGVHSNGFSLVRKIMDQSGARYEDVAPFSTSGSTFGTEFLTPTKIYVKSLLPALRSGKVKALAHITGGGLTENIPRVLPAGVRVQLDARQWPALPVLAWLAARGGVGEAELLRTFNCGLGAVLIVGKGDAAEVVATVAGETCYRIGTVEQLTGVQPRVQVDHFVPVMSALMRAYAGEVVRSRMVPPRKRVGVLVSGGGTNLQALLDATRDPHGTTGAEIVLVISNKEGVEGLERARRANIPTLVIKHSDYATRLAFDMSLHAALTSARVDLVCLAGFMRVLTGDFVRLWRGRLINIHPALLPLFKGTHAHRQALQAGVRVTGCTAHFVEEDVDAGAILVQEAVLIEPDDTEESLQERVKLVEHRVYPRALSLVATGRVRLGDDNKLIWQH